jgi:hypothetical protein
MAWQVSYVFLLAEALSSADNSQAEQADRLKVLKVLRLVRLSKMLRLARIKRVLQKYHLRVIRCIMTRTPDLTEISLYDFESRSA